ncbi:hypothetical protein S1OALGB6SA_2292 [Olavius algarvensis spirochete endosymbiont]|nr:hypothetical protein S1OALGB6SA_2292 [Olavius algarvensis spirochete endosymbiont]
MLGRHPVDEIDGYLKLKRLLIDTQSISNRHLFHAAKQLPAKPESSSVNSKRTKPSCAGEAFTRINLAKQGNLPHVY